MEPLIRTFSDGKTIELVDYYPDLSRTYTFDEQETMAWIVEHAQSNWVTVDVGAHVGIYTMLLARLCKWVHAFEACPDTYAKLLANLKHNGYGQNVTAHLVAVGDESAERNEWMWFAGRASVGKPQEVREKRVFTTLDALLWPILDRLDFLKVDVDGWDLEVLWGAQALIARHRPYISVEVNKALERRGHRVNDISALVAQMGYAILPMDCPAPGNWLLEPR